MIEKFLTYMGAFALVLGALTACGSGQQPAVPPSPAAPTVQATDTAPAEAQAAPANAAEASAPTTVSQKADFDRRAMLAEITESLILPLHKELLAETQALERAVAQFAQAPSPETLETAQVQWRTTADAWSRVEPFGLRFTMLVFNQIKKWPVNTIFIEEFIAEEETIDEPFIASIGSTAKGLTAIEYFLFSQELTNPEIVEALTTAPKRMAYLTALSQNLVKSTDELVTMWSPDGGNQAQAFVDADFSGANVQGSMSMLANELIVLVETVANTKLEYPLRGVLADPQPDSVESPYAAYSLPLIVNNLRTLQQILNAGLGDYVDRMAVTPRQTPLSAAIDAQIEETIATIEAIDIPLRAAVLENPDAVRAARDSVKDLLVLLKVDMANQLGITVTFSDNDGD